MVTYQYAPAVDGGAERQAQQLAERLADRGHEVGVATVRYPGLRRQDRLNSVAVHRLWGIAKPGYLSVTFLPSLAGFLLTRGRRFDVWHVHQAYYSAWIALRLAPQLGKRCIVKAAASGPFGDVARLRSRRWGRFVEAALSSADAMVSVNAELSQELLAVGVAGDRIRLIPNGVDTDRFAPATVPQREAARAALSLPRDGTVVAYIGRLAPEKGIDTLFDSWQALEPDGRCLQSHLVLAGDGPSATTYRARAAATFQRVSFLGKVDDVLPLLHAADLLVLPSLSEGVSNAVLEAMATGLPVVGTRIGGLTQQIHDGRTGLLVAPGDAEGMAVALAQLLGDPRRRAALGAAGRRLVEACYGFPSVVDAYERLYDELVS